MGRYSDVAARRAFGRCPNYLRSEPDLVVIIPREPAFDDKRTRADDTGNVVRVHRC